PDLCHRWSTPRTVIVAAGCGDNFAGTLGAGASHPGQAALSIGTSGVLCCVDSAFHPAPAHAVLTAPHAVPATFLSMSVIMSATQSLEWLARITNTPVSELTALAQHRVGEQGPAGRPLARPSLTGIRTPHNRMDASGFLGGFTVSHDTADLAYAFMEGIAFQFHESFLAQNAAGVHFDAIAGIGGGTRSSFWVSLIATLLKIPITIPDDSGLAACRGAARLAHAASSPHDRDTILTQPIESRNSVTLYPETALYPGLIDRYHAFNQLPLTPTRHR
ncbi:MAG: FGGY-family carbohydrate kinase, partial [Rhodobacteraceae bacterium]|nr:FGGY-family carbohydrate kinase [Paracoccaceae bacterium]